MLKQSLQQKILQKLSPQQIQLMKLLQLPTLALEQRIKQEIEENPALEEGKDDDDDLDYDELEQEEDIMDIVDDDKVDENISIDSLDDYSDYFEDNEIPNYKLNISNTSPDEERKEAPNAIGVSFHDYLLEQLGLRVNDDKQYIIGLQLIGSLDDTGYLQRDIEAIVDDLAFTQNITATADEVNEMIHIIQEFDPPGVGARNLKECLLLQLKRKMETDKSGTINNARLIIENNFDDFTKKHYDKIIKKHNFSEDTIKKAYEEILKLNPKPGNSHAGQEKSLHYITPDFIIRSDDTGLTLTLNSRNAPELHINRNYGEIYENYLKNKKASSENEKDAIMFIKHKMDSAKWFIDAIQQRQHTLMVTMKAIMDYQREFFETGDRAKMKPMILKDIADKVGLDISTVSRVNNSKYVETPYGIFLLKDFFSESLQTSSGEEVSTIEVKKILKDCVIAEDKKKPLTDEELVGILKQKGYNIARRTVAKYREQLDIPVARMRKEL